MTKRKVKVRKQLFSENVNQEVQNQLESLNSKPDCAICRFSDGVDCSAPPVTVIPPEYDTDCCIVEVALMAYEGGKLKEEPIREGGNLFCPYCGQRFKNRDFIDADHSFTVSRIFVYYGEDWYCPKCKKQMVVGELVQVIKGGKEHGKKKTKKGAKPKKAIKKTKIQSA